MGELNQYEPVEITAGLFWVGDRAQANDLHCNPYLLIDGASSVLFDPGSVLDAAVVRRNIEKLLPLEKVDWVVLSHQDPDLVSGLPLLEEWGLQARIIAHWRTATIAKYYGIKSEFVPINVLDNRLLLTPERELAFLPAPYLHFPGSIVTYDHRSGTLVSGDLFGAFTRQWSLYAGDDYLEAMKAFHEHYMPGNSVLRPVMEQLLQLPIKRICPQHGSVISERIREHIVALRELECGAFLHPVRKSLTEQGGYRFACEAVLRRYRAVFGPLETASIFSRDTIILDEKASSIIDSQRDGVELWHHFFSQAYTHGGEEWLTVVEPLVEKLVKQYDIPYPEIFKSRLLEQQQQVSHLQNRYREVQQTLEQTKEELWRCPLTGLYNNQFFYRWLERILGETDSGGVLQFAVDRMQQFNDRYGSGDQILRDAGYFFNEQRHSGELLFKLDGPGFLLYVPDADPAKLRQRGEELRSLISQSRLFVERVTLSVGAVLLQEIPSEKRSQPEAFLSMLKKRTRSAAMQGGDRVCSKLSSSQQDLAKPPVVIGESDRCGMHLLKMLVEQSGFRAVQAESVEEALQLVMEYKPVAVIVEEQLPGHGALHLQQLLNKHSSKRDVPLLMVTRHKSGALLRRAYQSGVQYVLEQPVMPAELEGLLHKVSSKGANG